MSVLVKVMKIPESCYYCGLTDTSFINCLAFEKPIVLEDDCEERRPDWCPLVALPDTHGRLGDLDALCEDLLERWSVAETRKEELIKAVMADVVTPIIACQPTIVEAEDES